MKILLLVGEACQRFHSIYRRSRGMYFSSLDRGQMAAMVHNWPHDQVRVFFVFFLMNSNRGKNSKKVDLICDDRSFLFVPCALAPSFVEEL